jgi:transcriptional regulator with XRE-family HTH domain
MNEKEIKDRLKNIISDSKSDWLEKAKWRKENREWLLKSAKIAVRILMQLRAMEISQKELAEKISVSPQYINKIVKGQENLSLETINKLEKALGIKLIEVPENKNNLIEAAEYTSAQLNTPVYYSIDYTVFNEQSISSVIKTLGFELLSTGTINKSYQEPQYVASEEIDEIDLPLAA